MKLAHRHIQRVEKQITKQSEAITNKHKEYLNSIESLKMEIKENEEFGNDKSSNMLHVRRTRKIYDEIQEMQSHLDRLCNMLVKGEM